MRYVQKPSTVKNDAKQRQETVIMCTFCSVFSFYDPPKNRNEEVYGGGKRFVWKYKEKLKTFMKIHNTHSPAIRHKVSIMTAVMYTQLQIKHKV